MVLKFSQCYIYNITVLGRTDFDHPIFSIISCQGCFYQDTPFIQNVSFVETQRKCYIFKIGEQFLYEISQKMHKLVNTSPILDRGLF